MKAIRKGRYHEVKCKGGPWAGLIVLTPAQDSGDPLSLPIRVKEHVGRYNLNNGEWVPHGKATCDSDRSTTEAG